jgi:uncharacterized RDD family membrane protein YckC
LDLDDWGSPTPEREGVVSADAFPAAGVNALASISSRAAARIIDTIVVLVPTSVVVLIVALATVGVDADAMQDSDGVVAWTTGTTFVLQFLYETVAITLWGQTLGKLVLGVRVARLANGRCPLWWESGIRVALPSLVWAIPHPVAQLAALGLYLVAMFDPLRRTVPDRAAGTVVVRAR